MKCPYCGYENKEDAVFCTRCGKKLPAVEAGEEELIHLAEMYTGIRAEAEKIVSENEKNVPAVRNACIAWIRGHEKLFDENVHGNDSDPVLASLEDPARQMEAMDYEERIVSLLHCYEKKSIPEISALLHISEDQVKGYLQDAYKKANGIHVKPYRKIERAGKSSAKKEKKEETGSGNPLTRKLTSAFRSRTAWRLEIAVACIAAIVLGSYFGIRSYANTQYESGLDLSKSGNYAEASSALEKAVRFHGGGEKAVLNLAEAYEADKQYAKATEQYSSYLEKYPQDRNVKKDLIHAYQKAADQALQKKDNAEALAMLEKSYEQDNSQNTYIRMQAVRNGGTFTSDVNETVYDVYARPVKIKVKDADSEELYTVNIRYRKGRISSLKAETKDHSVTLARPETTGNYTFSLFPDLSWQSERDMYDQGTLAERDYAGSGITASSIVYENEFDRKSRVKSRTFTWNGTEITDTYTWKNGQITRISRTSADEDVVFRNTWKKKLLEKTVITSGNLGEIGHIEYEYDASGNLTDQIETHAMLSGDEREPFMKNRHLSYTYDTDGTPMTCTVRTGDNELAGYGTYLKGTGWLMCYIQKEG